MKLGQFIKILRDIKHNCGDLEVMLDKDVSIDENNFSWGVEIDENNKPIKNRLFLNVTNNKKMTLLFDITICLLATFNILNAIFYIPKNYFVFINTSILFAVTLLRIIIRKK